jgi:hypothetical protein
MTWADGEAGVVAWCWSNRVPDRFRRIGRRLLAGLLTAPGAALMADLDRLGKRGSYRLGQLRVQGAGPAGPPPPRRPRFRARHRGPTSLWLLAAAAGAAVIAGGAAAGLWFAPLAVGLAAGLVNRFAGWRPRVLVPAVAAMAVAGWGIPLWWPALHGQPAGGTAPVIAALASLPGSAAGGVLVALLAAVLQALAGLWLGRALTPRPRPVAPAPETPSPAAADPAVAVPDAADPAPAVSAPAVSAPAVSAPAVSAPADPAPAEPAPADPAVAGGDAPP